MSIAALTLALALTMADSVSAAGWASKMFRESRHDFGTIARSAKAEYEFQFTNLYLEDVHVSSVRTTCACTTPRIKDDKRTLKTYETGAIVAHINSDTFLGNRSATLTVTFDKPFFTEVQLHVSVYIRDDVVLQPGVVEFGTVPEGTAADRQIRVTTPGRINLRITGVESSHPHLAAQVVPSAGMRGSYTLHVRLSDKAPPGYVNDHLLLTTNDSRLQIPVPVEGIVRSGLSVSPDWITLGLTAPGERITKHVVVRGPKPFIITRVIPAAGFQCDVSKAQEPKQVHILPVIFTAGPTPGRLAQTLRIETDLGQTVDFVAEAIVRAPAGVLTAQHTENGRR